MNAPTTIDEFLDNIKNFLSEGYKINTSDLSHEMKLSRLTTLSETYGLA